MSALVNEGCATKKEREREREGDPSQRAASQNREPLPREAFPAAVIPGLSLADREEFVCVPARQCDTESLPLEVVFSHSLSVAHALAAQPSFLHFLFYVAAAASAPTAMATQRRRTAPLRIGSGASSQRPEAGLREGGGTSVHVSSPGVMYAHAAGAAPS